MIINREKVSLVLNNLFHILNENVEESTDEAIITLASANVSSWLNKLFPLYLFNRFFPSQLSVF